MVSPIEHILVARPATVHNRRREAIRTPEEPTLESVHDACVLSVYGSTILVLAHARENTPVTIHRLHHLSPVSFHSIPNSFQ